jgi:protein-tyrosine phosphatase
MPHHPDRLLPLQGTSNFRDLGGYRSANGRSVRWRRLFRSDHLAGLSEQDVAQLQALGLSRSFDLRGERERAAQPYALPGVRVQPLPIEPTVVQRLQELRARGESLTAAHTVRLMQETYRAFVTDNSPRFAELFAHLLERDLPSVVHCTAGKDRTGFAVALVLLALGVPRQTVMHDYLLTNHHYRMPEAYAGSAPNEVLRVLWQVQEDFLHAAFDAIERDFGGLESYLNRALALTPAARERLAQMYLQAPLEESKMIATQDQFTPG